MRRDDGGTTSPTLLDRLGDWGDHRAWSEFLARYEPAVLRFVRPYRLDAEATEELCQRVWIELARRLRTYRYDPGKTFRGWLRRLCQSRAIDFLRQRKADPFERLDIDPISPARPAESEADDDPGRPLLLRRGEEVQRAVRARVDPKTWGVFWGVAVEGGTVREAAEAAGMTYAAAFAAQKRVGRMLREEGVRLLATEERPCSPAPQP